MNYQLFLSEDPGKAWILKENNPESDSVVAVQVTSDGHPWTIVEGSETIFKRSDLQGSYKHIDIE